MSNGSMLSRYEENEIRSRSPEWLVPLLYEHLLKSLTRAAIQIETGDLEGKANSFDRAQRIILELQTSLDTEQGGELAGELGRLYAFWSGELLTASRTLDVAHLKRVTAMVSELHEAWVQAAEQLAPRGGAIASASAA